MIRLELPNYIREVVVSQTTKPKYITLGVKIPKKYQNSQYVFVKGVLANRTTGLPVVVNAARLSDQKKVAVNGQLLYNGYASPFVRSTLVNAVKAYMYPFVVGLPKLTGPLRITTHLYCPIGRGNWDLDNLWIYNKCFQDLLVKLGKIPDDNVQHITSAGGIEFFPVDLEEDRKLVYVIQEDTRLHIQTHPSYATPRNPTR